MLESEAVGVIFPECLRVDGGGYVVGLRQDVGVATCMPCMWSWTYAADAWQAATSGIECLVESVLLRPLLDCSSTTLHTISVGVAADPEWWVAIVSAASLLRCHRVCGVGTGWYAWYIEVKHGKRVK